MDEVKNNHFIEDEMNKHSDLLLVNLTNESYQNLAKKTLMAFRFLLYFLKFFLKCQELKMVKKIFLIFKFSV